MVILMVVFIVLSNKGEKANRGETGRGRIALIEVICSNIQILASPT